MFTGLLFGEQEPQSEAPQEPKKRLERRGSAPFELEQDRRPLTVAFGEEASGAVPEAARKRLERRGSAPFALVHGLVPTDDKEQSRAAPEAATKKSLQRRGSAPLALDQGHRDEDVDWSATTVHDFVPCGRPLEKGALGKVTKVVHKATGQIFAMKTIPKALVQEKRMEDRVRSEIEKQKKRSHPNLLRMYHCCDGGSNLHLMLEFAKGGTLFAELRRRGRFDESEGVATWASVARAVDYMHGQGMAHGSLKPENVLLGNEGATKLADFGWCAELEGELESTFCGATDYLAPETIRGELRGRAADIWALGILLYELLTDRSPFGSSDERAAMLQNATVELQYPDYISEQARDLIGRLLVKEQSQRLPLEDALEHPLVSSCTAWLPGGASRASRIEQALEAADRGTTSMSPKKRVGGAGTFLRRKKSQLASGFFDPTDSASPSPTFAPPARSRQDEDLGARSMPASAVFGDRCNGAATGSMPPSAMFGGRDEDEEEDEDELENSLAAEMALMTTSDFREVRQRASGIASQCHCGNIFLPDERFCRKCGEPRPGSPSRSPTRSPARSKSPTKRSLSPTKRKEALDMIEQQQVELEKEERIRVLEEAKGDRISMNRPGESSLLNRRRSSQLSALSGITTDSESDNQDSCSGNDFSFELGMDRMMSEVFSPKKKSSKLLELQSLPEDYVPPLSPSTKEGDAIQMFEPETGVMIDIDQTMPSLA